MCKGNLSAFANKTTYIRSPTAHESRHLVHEMVDFIYLDTRHDYCEVRDGGRGGRNTTQAHTFTTPHLVHEVVYFIYLDSQHDSRELKRGL